MLAKYKNMSVTAKAAFWFLISGIVQKGINVLVTPVFTRILTTEEYAQYTLYQSWHEIFIIFTSLYVFNYATYTAMVRFEEDRLGFILAAQTLVTGLTFLGFAVCCITYDMSGNLIGFPLPVIALMFLDMLCISAFNLWAAKERYDFHYKLMTFLSILIGILGPLLGVAATDYSKNRGYGRIYGVSIVNIIIGFIIFIYNIYRAPKKKIVLKYWKYIFSFCIPLIPHFLSAQLLVRFDRIMINEICGASETAIYSLAYSLSMLMSIVSDAVLKVFTPWTYQAIKNGNMRKIKYVANMVILLVVFSNLLLILFAPEAIKIFATDEYLEAIYIIPAVSASVFFTFLYNVFANIEYYYSETKFIAAASILASVLNVILNYLLIPRFGYIAAGYTTLASYMIYSIAHFFVMRLVSKKHENGFQFYDCKFILIVSAVFTGISLFITTLYSYTLIRYFFILLIGIGVVLNKNKITDLFYKLRKKETIENEE